MVKIGLFSEDDIEKVQKYIKVEKTNNIDELQTCRLIIVNGLSKLGELVEAKLHKPLIVLLENSADLNNVPTFVYSSLIFYRYKHDPIDTLKETIFLIDKITKE